jgi:hypothetical protein
MMIAIGGPATIEFEIARMNGQIGWCRMSGHDFLENMQAHEALTVRNLKSY